MNKMEIILEFFLRPLKARGNSCIMHTCPGVPGHYALKHNERTETTVSASKKNKQDLELERQRQREEEQRAERRSMRLYAAVAVLCAVLGVAVLVMNTGILQRTVTAVSVNGTNYSAADLEYYYNVEYQNLAYNAQTYALYGLSYGFDYTKDPSEQVYDQATGQTWEEYLWTVAKEDAAYVTALVEAANAAGYTLGAEAQESRDTVLKNIETTWIGNYNSRDAYLRAVYGSYITYSRFVELLDREVLAKDYADSVISAVEYGQEDYDAYYAENADVLDTFTLTQFVFRAPAPTTDEEGNELTEEQMTAAWEELKAEKKALAEELKTRLEAGEDAKALAAEYDEELYSTSISGQRGGSVVASSRYGEWAVADERREGDVSLTEYDATSAFNYYVVRFEGRGQDNTKTADVRHILVAADVDEGAAQPTDAQFEAAKVKAEEILAGWDGTEEGFAALAAQYSADTMSAADGGLIADVSTGSGYIAEFTDWCLDDARKSGDTGIVKNTGSSVMGWHIMYYVADGLPTWKQSADDAMREADYAAWQEEVTAGYEAVEGFGMKFL